MDLKGHTLGFDSDILKHTTHRDAPSHINSYDHTHMHAHIGREW